MKTETVTRRNYFGQASKALALVTLAAWVVPLVTTGSLAGYGLEGFVVQLIATEGLLAGVFALEVLSQPNVETLMTNPSLQRRVGQAAQEMGGAARVETRREPARGAQRRPDREHAWYPV